MGLQVFFYYLFIFYNINSLFCSYDMLNVFFYLQNLPHFRKSSSSVHNSSNVSSSYTNGHVGWNDNDRCNVCHMDEVFLK